METLIIGGNGLVGTALIKKLCERGEKIISFSSRPPEYRAEGCTYYQGDITEYGTINMIFKNHRVARVIHNAAISHPKLFTDNPYKIFRVNVTGTLTALEAARNFGVQRFVYMSSCAVYGDVKADVVDETFPLYSNTAYGASKIACENIVRTYGLDTVALRCGFIYGPLRKFECPVNQILTDLIKTGNVNWSQGIDQHLDFIYVDDCVDAVIAVAYADTIKHAEYNVGGGEMIPFRRIVDQAQKIYPYANIHVGSGDLGYDSMGMLSIQRLYNDYGWKPTITIEEGMKKYNSWLRKNMQPSNSIQE